MVKKVSSLPDEQVKNDFVSPSITVEDIIGGPEPAKTGTEKQFTPRLVGSSVNGFNGVVDDRVIPDAGLPTEPVAGVLDLTAAGHGYLRPEGMPSDHDIYISSSQIRRFQLRPGDIIGGQARRPKENERYWGLLKVETVNGEPAEKVMGRPWFDQLTPIFPNEHLVLETEPEIISTRLMDLVSPIGKGQRGLIVSPPKAGKTYLIKDIAAGVAKNYPNVTSGSTSGEASKTGVHLMAVLIGERPEEVTDIQQHIKTVTNGDGEVYASNFDEAPEEQTHIAELALERAKRLVEQGRDVVIVLDSITRLARAYNLAMPTSGRTLSGGFDPAALFPAKHFLGAARNIDKGGSLTIIGTCLIDTGSRMDDLIYEEFKGTGNLELHLDRRLAERRVFPAFDIQRSGTRQEELLFDKKTYEKIVTMRRMIDILSPDERTEVIVERLKKTKKNKEFLESLSKG
ncbi:MAG TPA: transcription termination factor Rho [Patescibacteria group bacterium]|nr:transcription termination factor Rho [Patescibacteria group bacterium]